MISSIDEKLPLFYIRFIVIMRLWIHSYRFLTKKISSVNSKHCYPKFSTNCQKQSSLIEPPAVLRTSKKSAQTTLKLSVSHLQSRRYRFSCFRNADLHPTGLFVGGHDLTSRLRPMIVSGLREEKCVSVDKKSDSSIADRSSF